jgi:PAS domain S-box-containing protein
MTTRSSFAQLVDFVPDAIVGVDPGGRIVLANHQAEALFGYPPDELIGQRVEVLVPERFREIHPAHRSGYFSHPTRRPMGAGVELVGVRRDGTEFPAEISLSSIETDDGPLAMTAVRDLTERAESERERALAEELNQARRLESVGQLAGGIAHDFNNLLGIIINYAKFVAQRVAEDEQATADIQEVQHAAKRAADLTRQLLIFSRREVVRPQVLDLNSVIGGLENLLQRALGERIELGLRLASELPAIEADPGQVEQVLVNLAVNARDAMPDGGRVLIETSRGGEGVRLTVSDTGVGMDPETRQRAFEPFFTTKPKGEGTGLGLATVYGIVTQAGGQIDLYSEPGLGTTVKLQLPATDAEPRAGGDEAAAVPAGRGERILVVEDEPGVRAMTERILANAGYDPVTASGGVQALELAAAGGIDLVLTDLIMPHMLGTEIVERLRADRPDLRVVFMSGFSHAILTQDAVAANPGTAFIEKPFTDEELLRVVRSVLDGEEQP